MLRRRGLHQIEGSLGGVAAGEFCRNHGREASALECIGRCLQPAGVVQTLADCLQLGVHAVQGEIRPGHLEDEALMRTGERHVGGKGQLLRALLRRLPPATEIDEQVFDRQFREYLLRVGCDVSLADQVGGERRGDMLVAAQRAGRDFGQKGGAGDPDADGGLTGLFPGDAGFAVSALGHVDQLEQGVAVRRVDVGRFARPGKRRGHSARSSAGPTLPRGWREAPCSPRSAKASSRWPGPGRACRCRPPA